MKLNKPPYREALAAEYVLGTLRGRARHRFENWMASDPALRQIVMDWERRLGPLAESISPVSPPAHIWGQIIQNIQAADASMEVSSSRLRYYVFWRNFSMAVSAVAAVLLFYIGFLLFQPRYPDYVAVINSSPTQEAWLVTTTKNSHMLNIQVIQPTRVPAGKSLELWALPDNSSVPVSLGLLPNTQGAVITAKYNIPPAEIKGLAVSLEPAGGSPLLTPTGPVLYQANWIKLPHARFDS